MSIAKINSFLQEHHVLSLATQSTEELFVCSLFYVYDEEKQLFIVASSKQTQHIQNLQYSNKIAGNILLETKEVGVIRGVQFQATMQLLEESRLKKLYYKTYPYALAMLPTLWKIEVQSFKMSDNRLGFGKKLLWSKN
jgi:hypothetical protein